jgi:hypothetical protein
VRRPLAIAALAALVAACAGEPAPEPPPPGSFAFGVFGDGPYTMWDGRRYARVLEEVDRADLAWLVHVGDILWHPCSDEAYRERFAELDALETAVVYTPGDNEWADCHGERQGRRDPLERLTSLRRIFFARPERSLGRRPIALATQAADPAFAGFPENARWERGGFVFATLHVVGSDDAGEPFAGRTAAHDSAAALRARAALAWLDSAFARARAAEAKGIVLVMHANIGVDRVREPRAGYDALLARLEERARAWPGTVLLIHGDSHTQRVDHPLREADGRPMERFTRLETFGSPNIGWVRVVVDTVAGRIARIEPRLARGM